MAATLISGVKHITSAGGIFHYAFTMIFGAAAGAKAMQRRSDRLGVILSYGPPTDLHM